MDAGHSGIILVGVGDHLAWRVDVGGVRKCGHASGDRLMGAAWCGKQLFLAGSEGALYQVGISKSVVFNLSFDHSFGLEGSTDSDSFIFFGAGACYCFTVDGASCRETARHKLDFDVYCCSYMSNGLIWAAGSEGSICEIDPRNSEARVRPITTVRNHVNAIAATPAGDRIYAVGQSGLAVELDRSGVEIAKLFPDRSFKSAAFIREQLLPFADDETIRRYIYEPSKLSEDLRRMLAARVGIPDYYACSLAPSLPILAVATQEASVVLIDVRDYRVIQEIDLGSGNSSITSAVHFLSDQDLVTVNGRGDVTFFRSAA